MMTFVGPQVPLGNRPVSSNPVNSGKRRKEAVSGSSVKNPGYRQTSGGIPVVPNCPTLPAANRGSLGVAGFCMPGDDVEIRPAKAGDSEQLWPLVKDFAFSYRPERSAFERSFSALLDRSDTLVLVAVSNAGAVVGAISSGASTELSSPTAPWHGLKNSWLVSLYAAWAWLPN
jgi:hypothetical protein